MKIDVSKLTLTELNETLCKELRFVNGSLSSMNNKVFFEFKTIAEELEEQSFFSGLNEIDKISFGFRS